MSREPGSTPQFGRMLRDLGRAREEWAAGNIDLAEQLLRVVGSIAIAESEERGPHDPIPD
jgi:hypothetical protein